MPCSPDCIAPARSPTTTQLFQDTEFPPISIVKARKRSALPSVALEQMPVHIG